MSKSNDSPTTKPTVKPTAKKRGLRWAAWTMLRVYLILVLLMLLLERHFIFFPSSDGQWAPTWFNFENVEFQSSDGTNLHGWFLEYENPRAVVLFAHGNAGNLSDRAFMVEELRRKYQVSVMIFDYRGYGKSAGKPDEPGILADARAARRWLAGRADVEEHDIVLMGRSLGGGVMVDLAAKDGARGLILESTFTSLPDVAATHYPWLPVRWIMRTRLDSLAKIKDYSGPLLQSHGTSDTLIPFELGKRLFDAAPSPEKIFIAIENAGHNDPQSDEYEQALDDFFKRLQTNAP